MSLPALGWESDITLPSGVHCGYCVAVSLFIISDPRNPQSKNGTVAYQGYISSDLFLAGADKLFEKSVKIDFASLDQGGQISAATLGLIQAALAEELSPPVEEEPPPEDPPV